MKEATAEFWGKAVEDFDQSLSERAASLVKVDSEECLRFQEATAWLAPAEKSTVLLVLAEELKALLEEALRESSEEVVMKE